ncbi:MAG TPA: TonB-dependent receptor [Acidobacteriota bacterium]|nr:TonB-dependent receptor [Acidobacteriota bacterium]
MRILKMTLCALFLAVPMAAVAQAPSADEPEQLLPLRATEFIFVEGSLPLVPTANTIASKLPLPLRLTPNNVGMVTAALFGEQQANVLGDALINVSGINTQPGFGGVHDFFVARGFDSISSSLILTDGAPEPEATFYQLYNVELVEVLKGPGGFLYGSNPLAGTVNLVRKQPFANSGLRISTSGGSFSTFDGTIDANHGTADGRVAFRVNALVRGSSGYRDNRDSNATAVNPALTWQLADGHSLNANFEYARADFSPEAGIPLLFNEAPPVRLENDYNAASDRSEQNVYRFQLDYEGRLSDSVRIRNKLYYRGLDWLSDGTLLVGAFPEVSPAFVPTGRTIVARSQIQLDDQQSLLGNQFEAIFDFDTGDVHHSLLTGIETSRYADEFALDAFLLASVDLFEPVEPGSMPIPLGSQGAGDARSIVIAPCAIDQITFADRLQVLAGARLDNIDFDDQRTGRSSNSSKLSPMLGAAWAANDEVSIYGNYSRSYAPPSPRAFEDLVPEESEQVELGIKLRILDGRAQATAAVYRLVRDNIAIPDDNGFTQQIGNQRSSGFELELAAEPGRGFRGVVSYAYNDAELTEFAERITGFSPFGVPFEQTLDHSGNRPAFAPEHLLNVWVSKTLDSGLGISLGARYIGNQFIAEDNAFNIDEALIVSGALAYDWSRYRISVNVQNLADSAYFVRGFGSQSITPGTPVAATLRLGYEF